MTKTNKDKTQHNIVLEVGDKNENQNLVSLPIIRVIIKVSGLAARPRPADCHVELAPRQRLPAEQASSHARVSVVRCQTINGGDHKWARVHLPTPSSSSSCFSYFSFDKRFNCFLRA